MRGLHFKLDFLPVNQFAKLDIPKTIFMKMNIFAVFCPDRSVFLIAKQFSDVAFVHTISITTSGSKHKG